MQRNVGQPVLVQAGICTALSANSIQRVASFPPSAFSSQTSNSASTDGVSVCIYLLNHTTLAAFPHICAHECSRGSELRLQQQTDENTPAPQASISPRDLQDCPWWSKGKLGRGPEPQPTPEVGLSTDVAILGASQQQQVPKTLCFPQRKAHGPQTAETTHLFDREH